MEISIALFINIKKWRKIMNISNVGLKAKNTIGLVGLGLIITTAFWTFIVFEVFIADNQAAI